MKYLYYYLFLINAVSLLLMLLDNVKAKKNLWRIPERVLLGICAAGGSLGGILGMKLFRHKTKHPQFSIGIPVMLALHIVALIVFYTM